MVSPVVVSAPDAPDRRSEPRKVGRGMAGPGVLAATAPELTGQFYIIRNRENRVKGKRD